MKKILFFILFLLCAGCSSPLREGECYFNKNYSITLKVNKMLKYGAFLTVIHREGTARMHCPLVSEENEYVAYESMQSNYFNLENDESHMIMIHVDCEAFDMTKEVH
jgi:hypothetical protein